MGKLFGQFLVEEKIITEDALLEALIHQLKNSPSTTEVIHDKAMLPTANQLEILAKQQIDGVDYRAAAFRLGYWNEELTDKVNAAVSFARVPLGEVLLYKNSISRNDLRNALGKFLAAACEETLRISSDCSDKNDSRKTVATVDLALTPCQKLDPILCAEYIELIDGKALPSLQKLILNLNPEKSKDSESTLLEVVGVLTTLKAASTFVSAPISMNLSTILVGTIRAYRQSLASIDLSELLKMLNLGAQAFNEISASLRRCQKEEDHLSERALKSLSQNISLQVKVLMDRYRGSQ